MDYSIREFPDLQFGTLYCIGRNYSDHIREMKSVETAVPVVFLKPRSSVIRSGDPILYPSASVEVHHEVELVLLLGNIPEKLTPENALTAIKAFAVGIDLTARDLQADAKKNGLPWAMAKGLKTFAPIGNFVEFDPEKTDLQNLDLRLTTDGEIRQSGNTEEMIFSVTQILCYLNQHFTLTPGDLIFTGTPEGVGPIAVNERITASAGHNLSLLETYVRA
ncbi:MAG: FAA hydrolase family protein [Balneolaceae bacterium]|nr:MAG: FAA hydrolase family protein [Balneolaceae bacterium]